MRHANHGASAPSAFAALSAFAACILGFGAASPASAATFADPKFSETELARGLNPTAMAIAPDGRIFVASKTGALRVYKNGQLLTKPFVTLTVLSSSEQGLIGVAFHPKFPDSNWVYVCYTASGPQHNRVSRFRADGDTAQGGVGGEDIVFDMDMTTAGNHNGGAIHFGNDGKLYVSSGNSASSAYGLDMNSTLGKMLRLEPDGSIPADNPFLAQTTGKARSVWTAGMRNTYTFAVDKVSGKIWGAEVGDGSEEINELIGGSNYGYGRQEGYTIPGNMNGIVGTFRPAIFTYSGGCIIAAAFYTPTGAGFTGTRNFPETFHRKFFYADHNNGYIRTLDIADPKNVQNFATGASNPVDIKFGADGVMYYVQRGNGGGLYKVTYSGGPVALDPAAKASGSDAGPRGWRMQVVRQGRIPWPDGATALEIMGLDGRTQVVNPRRKAGDRMVAMPASMRDGVYFVRPR